jgi:hypothetical protein
LQPIPISLNETGTPVSERVHPGEIVVISVTDARPGRLPSRDGADISAAIPASFQGRNHGD